MSHMKHLKHLKIPLETINFCTQNFNKTNLIGKGGYGKVYKGILSWADHQNQLVAVKRLDDTGFQGNKEFYTEITMLSQYRHKNIITLVGFCDDVDEMILVYEYATHGSLDTYLTDDSKNLDQLSWKIRINICVGIASALDYLHNHVAPEHRVIHRDMKSSNILLDEKWNPKLSDFGLSRIGLANQQNTFVITNVAGTHGYCDPQYERTGILTKESDVYSFGVVLFEVLCGRLVCVIKYHDERRFLHHLVRSCYEKGELHKIVDYRIMDHIKSTTMTKFSAIAYQCIQETRQQRPTIAEVLRMLREIQFERSVIGTSSNRTESSSTGTAIESTSGSQNVDHVDDNYIQPPVINDGVTSDALEGNNIEDDGPGIEDFQINGDAKPGGKLLACGFSLRGTSSCMFQWVRYLQDGTREDIKGARKAEYEVTADDVNKFIAVECIPMDDQGRKGEIVQLFANERNKITCDRKMQQEIDKYISAGEASFSVFLQIDFSENWLKATFTLTRFNYQIKIDQTQHIFIEEKYSSDISIEIPSGHTTQFVLTRLNGFSCTFHTFHDFRMRDTLVLTMRMFQSKVYLEGNKHIEGPGIEGFHVIGDAKPGGKLIAYGLPLRGTSLVRFQWVRYHQDVSKEFIEGATSPEYVVTADDVNKLISVECIPTDDQGRHGEMVRLFANEQNKITCDPEMQQEIDKYMSASQASFSVLLQMDSSENWEQTTFFLKRSSYQIKINRTQDIFIEEKYSSDLSIKIPSGLTAQLVLTRPNGSSHPFNTLNDVRMRDTLVLAMRMFQSKALDKRRKTKA